MSFLAFYKKSPSSMWQFLREKKTRIGRIGSICLDLIVAAASFWAAYVSAFGLSRARYVPGFEDKTAAFVAVCFIVFSFFRLGKGSWRYVSIPDLVTVIKSSVVAVVIYTVVAFVVARGENIPRSVPVFTILFLIVGLSTTRLTYRLLVEGHFLNLLFRQSRPRNGGRNVLVVGLTHNAESFIRATTRNSGGGYTVLGIIDDARANRSHLVHGIKVVGPLDELEQIAKRHERAGTKIVELVVAEHQPSRQRLSEIVELATHIGLKVTRIPDLTVTESINSNFLLEPKPIELSDLLGRPEVTSDVEGVAHLINGRVVLATGAAGSIGSELCRQIAKFSPSQLVITDSSEFHLYLLDKEMREAHPTMPIVTRIVNVRDKQRVDHVVDEFKPEVIFHAAALKHVPLVEENALEGIKTNVIGTMNVANAAFAQETSTFVMISTDKAVNPTNIMGATKRAAEAYCQSLDVASEKTRFKTVRFGNVLGSNGSVVPRFREQIAAGGPVTVTHPHIVRYFMTIPEAVRLVLHASSRVLPHLSDRGRIMVLDMGKPVRIVDLAERMIQLAGYKPRVDIDIVFTGLRPGEKLYEELFDPSELQDGKTEEGYVVASPRIIDRALLLRSIDGIQAAIEQEDTKRAVEFLSHIVPEYRKTATASVESGLTASIIKP
jgi:O-antigen biosynthesis protein WbqV